MQIKIDTITIIDRYPLSVWGNAQTIDSALQQLYITASVADWLSRSSGLYVKNYGGSSLATVGIRGLSAQHTQVSWNGVPINSPMLGLIDVSLLPVGGSNSVQLCYGNTAVQEQNAIGGALILQSKPNWNNAFSTQIHTQLASFGNYQLATGLSAGTQKWYANVNIMGRWAANDYIYRNVLLPNQPITRQVPENAQQYNLNAELYRQINTLHTLSVKYWGNSTNRHLQPPIVGSNFNEHQTDQSQRLMLQWDGWMNAKQRHRLTATAALLNDYLWYNNDTASIESSNHSRTQFMQVSTQHLLNNKWQLNTQSSYRLSTIFTNNYGNVKPPLQQQYGTFVKVQYQPSNKLKAELLARLQQTDHRPILLLPALAIAYIPLKKGNKQWQFNASTALNARNPTLNDLYWYPGGNPYLTHETGFTQEIGTAYNQIMPERKNTSISSQLTVYYTHINNLIAWLPISSVIWEPQNRKAVAASGIEWRNSWSKKGKIMNIKMQLNYTFSRSINLKASSSTDNSLGKQLPYVPLHSLYANAQISRKNYSLLYENTLISKRYTTTDNNLSGTLQPYFLVNVHANAQWEWEKLTLQLNASVNNLLNTTYYPINYRPAPLRSFVLGSSIIFKKTNE